MLLRYFPASKEQLRLLEKECQELILIFGKIISSLRNGKK